MKIAVCERSGQDAQQLATWIRQYCALYGLSAALELFSTPEELARSDGQFHIAYLAFGGVTGFTAARTLRERNMNCRIILVDDTQEYAVRSVRIHCTDFLVRPVSFRQVVRSMSLATRGPGL